MAETTTPSATTPVTDRRPVPLGVVPRRMQTWIMAGLAMGMLLVMFVVGRPQPPSRTTPTTTPASAPSPDRLRDYQDRLRIMETRAAQEAQAAINASAAVPSPTAQEPTPPPAATTTDPIESDRKRRAYESLFASNVVLSRRPADQRPSGSGDGSLRATTPTSPQEPAPGVPPNLDDVANAVVRATARYGATAPTTASTLSPSAPSQASNGAAAPAAASGRRTPPRTDPIDPSAPVQRLLEGTVIDTVLTNRLDGATASPVNCLVTNPIYSLSGQHVLIPAGSRVLGETRSVQSVGESRLAVAFHRLLFPDGRTVSLDQFTGLNQRGDAALSDQVNHHYWSMFGAAAAVGLVSGLGQAVSTVGFGNAGDRTVVIAGGLGNATSEATAQVMNRFLNRLPTITIREGHRVEVYLTGDLELPVYETRPISAPASARVQ